MSNQWQPPGGGGGYPPPGGYGAPPPGYGPQPGYAPPANPYAPPAAPYGQQPYAQGYPQNLDTTGATILGVLTLLLACLPGGIVALHFARNAKTLAQTGRMDEARSKLRTSYIISAVCLALGIPFVILYFMAQTQ